MRYGLIPELVGRIPVVTVLDPLDEDALVRVLKEPKNSLVKQYQALMGLDHVELEITDEALHAIAKKTIALKSGARPAQCDGTGADWRDVRHSQR